MGSATPVEALDLPYVDTFGLERDAALVALAQARQQHWLARTPLGYVVTTHAEAISVLRERRFHSALALIPQMQEIGRAHV